MLTELQALVWIVIGFLLIITELFVSGLVVVFFGTAAVATGIALWLGMPSNYGLPFIAFTVLTLAQIYFLRGVFSKWFHGRSFAGPGSGVGDDEFIGKEAEVVSGFESGSPNGRVSFRGTEWTARGDEALAPGDRVVISGREGHTLHVTRTAKSPSL